MADGGDNEPNERLVRRQVILTVRCIIDVPEHCDEESVQFLVEQSSCRSDFIMSLAEQIAHDDTKGECNVCVNATATLVPVSEEVKSPWLDNLPGLATMFGGDEDDVEDEEDEEDVEDEEDEDGDKA